MKLRKILTISSDIYFDKNMIIISSEQLKQTKKEKININNLQNKKQKQKYWIILPRNVISRIILKIKISKSLKRGRLIKLTNKITVHIGLKHRIIQGSLPKQN